jgi:HD-like signal output (HDOD) protein
MNANITSQIQSLPPLPESVQKIEAVYHNPMATFQDINAIVEKDPLLTATLLKAANSPLYGFSREIKSVQQAVSLFGMGTVRGFALATITKQSFKLNFEPYGISEDTFSKISEKQHALLVSWIARVHPDLMSSLSPAVFLVELGKVLISQCTLTEGNNSDFLGAIRGGDAVENVENQFCGTTTAKVSASIFEHWNFEPAIVDVIRAADTPEEAGENIKKMVEIMHVIRTTVNLQGNVTDESIAAGRELIEKYGLNLEKFDQVIENLK